MGAASDGTEQFMGPLVALIVNKIGFKPAAIVGSAIATSAMAVCSVTDNFIVLQICYGFMMGVGASFLYLPSTTVCAFYFKDRQALATGLAYSGAGFGFTFIPLAYRYITEGFVQSFACRAGFIFVRTIFVQNGKCSPFLKLTPTL